MEPRSAWQPHVRQGHTHMQSNVQGCLKATAKPTATVTCRNYWYQCYIPLCFSGDIMIRYPAVLQLSAGASNIVLIIHTTELRYRKVRWFPQIHTADVAHAFLFKPLLIWLECEGFSVGLRNLCIFTRTRRLLCRGCSCLMQLRYAAAQGWASMPLTLPLGSIPRQEDSVFSAHAHHSCEDFSLKTLPFLAEDTKPKGLCSYLSVSIQTRSEERSQYGSFFGCELCALEVAAVPFAVCCCTPCAEHYALYAVWALYATENVYMPVYCAFQLWASPDFKRWVPLNTQKSSLESRTSVSGSCKHSVVLQLV